MRLYPQDLGPYWHPRLIGRRSAGGGYGDVNVSHMVTFLEPPPPRTGFLGRVWAGGSGLSKQQVAAALPASTGMTGVPFYISTLMGTVASIPLLILALRSGIDIRGADANSMLVWLPVVVGAFPAAGLLLARAGFRRVHRLPLKEAEVEMLQHHAGSPLQRQFLDLVRTAVRLPVPAAEEERLRTAIRALAAAVVSLPPVQLQALDTSALRAEAAQLQAQATAETDRVTAESLHRRAKAVLQRADTNEQSAVLARRTAALQAELEAQIAALRDGLAVYQTPTGNTGGIHELAEAALQVAAEAANVASARAELDHAVNGWSAPAPEQPAPATLTRA